MKKLHKHLFTTSTLALTLIVGLTPASAQTSAGTATEADPAVPDAPAQSEQITQTDDPGTEDEIVVTGIRASLESAQAIKRDAVGIVDAIVAQDIGRFPDNSASEALARVTGVQVTRDNDQANGVSIRGLPNVATTLFNREIFTVSGRAVALQDFPAQALAKVEVYKATTARNLEGGIAGLVNIDLRRPFDFAGFTVAGMVRASYTDLAKKVDPNGSLLISNRWDTGIGEVGVLLNASYTQSRYNNFVRYQGFQDYLLPATETAPAQIALPTSVGRAFTFPQDIGLYDGKGNRRRPSLNGSIQWRPNDDLEVYIDGLYQGYRERTDNDYFGIPIQGGRPTLRNVVLTEDRTTISTFDAQLGILNGPAKWLPVLKTDTYQGAIGAKYKTGNAVFTTDLAYTYSVSDNTYYGLDTLLTKPFSVNVGLNVAGSVNFVPSGLDFNDPASYIVRGFQDQTSSAKGKQIQWSGDMTLDTGSETFPEFQIGLRYANRDASSQLNDRYASLVSLGIPLSQFPSVSDSGGIIDPGRRTSDIQQFRSYYAASANGIYNNIPEIRNFVRSNLVRAGANAATIAAWAPELPAYNPINAFAAKEVVYTTYTQLKFAGAALGVDVDGVIGARVVITDNDLKGTTAQYVTVNGASVTQLVPVGGKNSYVDILPNININFHLTDQLQLRATRTEALSRPGFNQINPAVQINQGTVGGGVSYQGFGGNAALQPIRSQNYDLSLEYYFSKTGSMSLAGFYRKIDGFISVFGLRENNPNFGSILVFRPQNAGSGEIKGVEAAFTTFFDFLPGWLSGFGVQLNGTYITGEQSLPTAPGLSGRIGPIPNISKWTYNLVGIYEKGPASVRLAYNYRTAYVSDFFGVGAYSTVYAGGVNRLDLSANYDITKNLTLTVEGANLLQPDELTYVQAPEYPRDARNAGRILSLGARFRF